MIPLAFAAAHLALLLGLIVGAAVSGRRARYGVRVGRGGTRYRRLSTPEMLKRIGFFGP